MRRQEEDFATLLGRYLADIGFTQQELANKIGVHRNTIVNWLNRTSQPTSRGQVLRLADELSLSKQDRKVLIQTAGFSLERWPTEIWTVPQQRDMFFTGRETVFQSLREFLVPGSTTALTQAISGLGGVGKTHTAIEYAYRFHQDYEAILWLQADTWEVLVLACTQLADILELPEPKEPDQIIGEVQQWLRKHHHWLLILDNIENLQEILPKFVPSDHHGCVLVTTRVQNVEPLAQTQMLSTMSEQEGVLFLLRRTKIIAAKAELEKASSGQYGEAKQIWQLMDGLPLALDQAGAYILETSCSFFTYQEQYARRRAELLPRRGKRFIGHEASVATTFSLAFERIKGLSPVAADVLRVCSLLYSEAIPEEIFQEGAASLELSLVENGSPDEALGVLQDYSLVLRNREGKFLSIHRLVQAVLQDEMEETERQLWAKRVTLAVNLVFPYAEHATWPRCERWLPHALRAADYIETDQIANEEAGRLLFKTALYLQDRGRYSEAGPLYHQALRIEEQQLGPEHHQVASTLNGLASLYSEQGKYLEAEPLFQRALRIREQQLGPGHPQVVSSLHGLATLYIHQGKLTEAELLYQQALSIWAQQLKPEHPRMVSMLTNLAIIYSRQGKYTEAEPLFQRALRIEEQQLGPEHPQVAFPLFNLANLYNEQGKYAEAEPLFQRALRIWEQEAGPEHPRTANILLGLASLYGQQGKLMEAEPLFQRVLRIWEQQLGSEHPLTAYVLNNLAELYSEQGKYTEAEPLFQRALHIEEQQLGPEHPQVAISLHGLANLYSAQGKYAEAEPLFQRVLHIEEQQLGPEHPRVAETMHDLAYFWETQGKNEAARTWYVRALSTREQTLGAQHPKTVETRTRFIALLYTLGLQEEVAAFEHVMNEEDSKSFLEE